MDESKDVFDAAGFFILISNSFLHNIYCVGRYQLYLSHTFFMKHRSVCCFVLQLLPFIIHCHNSRFMLLILMFLLEKVLLFDNRWSSSLRDTPAKQRKSKHAARLTVLFLNSRRRSSKLTPVFTRCATLLTGSSQRCCHIRYAMMHLKCFVLLRFPPEN